MSDFKFTKEQAAAVKDLDNDIVLGAGAGSGKTRVLVSRFIELLKEKRAEVEEIMALTFTKKAAAEMQERIRQEIIDREEAADNFKQKKYWYRQKLNLNSAIISTFHSFAANILRQYPVISEVDPEFQVLEENEAAELLEETIDEVIEEGLNEEKEEVIKLVRTYNLYFLPDKLTSIYLEMRKDSLNVEEMIKLTFDSLAADKKERESQKDTLINQIEGLIKVFKTEGATGKTIEKMQDLIAEWPTLKRKIREVNDVEDDYFSDIIGIKDIIKGRLSSNLNGRAKEIKELLKSKEFKSFFIIDKAEEIIRPLTEVIQSIEERYTAKKENNSYLDFFDLQDRLIKVLRNSSTLRDNLNEQFKYIMVDEFQDNNPVQEDIIELLGRNEEINIFLVGDPKQSIYRFRGADVRVFNRQKEVIKDRQGEVYKLSKNFRSRPSILRFVNFLFEQILENDAEIDYQPLTSFREEEAEDIELNLIAQNEFEEKLNSEELRELEAEYLAEKVAHIIDNEDYLIQEDGNKRKVKPEDISYLFQALSDIELYENALLKKNISVNVVNGRGFYEQQVVIDIINLIKVIENNYRDFALTGLLRSPFCGLNDNEIYKVNKNKDGYLWDYLKESNFAEIKAAKRNDLNKFINKINQARALKDVKNPYNLIKQLIEDCNYKEALKADKNYKQQWANLDKVLLQIKDLYQQRNCSLREVLEFYQKNRENETREGQAELKSKEGSVQLMSVHQAKGLEFPVVILPDIQRGLIHHNSIPDILIDQKEGLGIKISTNEYNLGTPLYNRLKDMEKELELYEKIRLLYVAMTRAEDKLILSGYTKNNRKHTFEDSKSWLDWLATYLDKESFDKSEEICFNYDNEELKLKVNIIKDKEFKTDFDIKHKEFREDIDIKEWDSRAEWENISDKISPVEIESKEHKSEISVTGLMEYERCTRLYYLRHIKRVPDLDALKAKSDKIQYNESSIDPLKKGLIIHRLYELSGLEDEPAGYMDQVLTEMNYTELDQDQKANLIDILKSYQNREKNYLDEKTDLTKDYHEKRFTLNFTNFYLKGTVDNIYLYEEGEIEIIDFKTNNIKKGEVKTTSEDYKLQLEAYALAVSSLFNKNKIKYRIEYLIPEVNYSKILNREQLNSIRAKIKELGNKIAESNKKEDFNTKANQDCQYCIYGQLCEK